MAGSTPAPGITSVVAVSMETSQEISFDFAMTQEVLMQPENKSQNIGFAAKNNMRTTAFTRIKKTVFMLIAALLFNGSTDGTLA